MLLFRARGLALLTRVYLMTSLLPGGAHGGEHLYYGCPTHQLFVECPPNKSIINLMKNPLQRVDSVESTRFEYKYLG